MANNKNKNRIMVFFLALSFFTISVFFLPFFYSTDSNSPEEKDAHSSDSSSSLSFIIKNALDSLEAENGSFKIGTDQSFRARQPSPDKYSNLSLSFDLKQTPYLLACISTVNNFCILNRNAIVEFMHDKDGMV